MRRRRVEITVGVLAVLYSVAAFLFWVYKIMTIGRH